MFQFFQIFRQEAVISSLMGVFLVLGILTRLGLGVLYQHMIRETDNMAATGNQQLKQCKLKFSHCFQLNHGVANIPVFVDKFLNRLAIGRISFGALYHLSGQLVLFSVACSGAGVCKSILQGSTGMEVLPFYIVSFLGLTVYFSVSTVVDIKGKREVLKTNLVDYLENHLQARIDVTDRDIQMLYGTEWIGKEQTERERIGKARSEWPAGEKRSVVLKRAATGFTKEQEKELEELLMEFLMS